MTPDTPHSEMPGPPTLASRAKALLRDVQGLVHDHLELAALEARRAGAGFARMVCAAVVISILWVSAWLALVAGAIVWATSEGVPWPGALAIAALVNILAGGALAIWVQRQAGEQVFAASLRQLRPAAVAEDGGAP
ncbi:MAG: phage holin family protein [Betaproteobacteria bacterium]